MEKLIKTVPFLKQVLIFINPEKKTKKTPTHTKFNFVRYMQLMSGVFPHWYLPNSSQFEASNFVFSFLDQYVMFYESIHACTFHNLLKDPPALLNLFLSIPSVHCLCLLCVFSFYFFFTLLPLVQSLSFAISHLSAEKALLINPYSWFYIIYILRCLLWWK